MELIPAIDIIDGKCVRLSQGDYSEMKVYAEEPLDMALRFEDAGLERLHLVDLDGARTGSVRNWKVLENIAGRTSLQIDFGGGVKNAGDVDIVRSSGARWVTVGSIAAKDPEIFGTWIDRYGAEAFLLGADVKGRQIAVHGWTETTALDIYDFIGQYLSQGIGQIFCTDVSKDGLLQGPSLDLYRGLLRAYPGMHLIASGGVSGMADLEALAEAGCAGVIIGKAIYEGRISLEELKNFKAC